MANKYGHFIYTIHWKSEHKDNVYSAETSKRISNKIVDNTKERLIKMGYHHWTEERLGAYSGIRSLIIRKEIFEWLHPSEPPRGAHVVITLVRWDRRCGYVKNS